MLGQAAASSININVAFSQDMQVYVQYGTATGTDVFRFLCKRPFSRRCSASQPLAGLPPWYLDLVRGTGRCSH